MSYNVMVLNGLGVNYGYGKGYSKSVRGSFDGFGCPPNVLGCPPPIAGLGHWRRGQMSRWGLGVLPASFSQGGGSYNPFPGKFEQMQTKADYKTFQENPIPVTITTADRRGWDEAYERNKMQEGNRRNLLLAALAALALGYVAAKNR